MYYLIYGFLYLLSLLPMWALYLLGDFVYLVLYKIFGYRKKVVLQNLSVAFPEKTTEEKNRIAAKFYRNFVDTFIETIKLFSASEAFLKKRVQGDFEVFNQLYERGSKAQVHLGHNFNWEMGNVAFNLYSPFPLLAVYMPLSNKTMDRVFRKMRARSGTILLPATDMARAFLPYRETQYLLGLVADQVPGNPEKAYWLNFFGKPAPFVLGPERGARQNNLPIIFVHITKKKRGHYYVHAHIETERPLELEEGELTRRYRDYLETVIRRHPDMWLWSHRRWKKEWKDRYRHLWIDTSPAPAAATGQTNPV
ncbi:lysophospholipid acyltransferase family protein [Flavihumibacter rivuli]|uniref:lysophospholipid acyltransferase family protein n=1 Tax=Flavihumibacter rivuli TaxID=2838156 RepID=UPI001BDECF90|nr:lysophospholipid acyltransferase family protein [Flavihumibacter rivuli]ULQ56187.1 lysophospholipid acyltransferase family protein [Flavihumibacter rivuli]